MGMTMTQKILAAHCGEAAVTAGQLINARLDIVLGNDITTPVAINEFNKAGFDSVFDKTRVNIVLDHFVPNKDIKSATQSKQCREFADKYDILNFYDVGQMGVEHALLPEKGIVTAGDCIIGADSHTCTYGGLGAFATGLGSTDVAAGMALGRLWFKVPPTIRVEFEGKMPKWLRGKDLILRLIGDIGVDGALYKALEFGGELHDAMSGEVKVVHVDEEAGAVCAEFLFGILQQESSLTYASCAFDTDKTVVPVNLIHEVAANGGICMLYQISVCSVKCFHALNSVYRATNIRLFYRFAK